VEEPAAVDDQVADAALSRINDHTVERADLHAGLRSHVERLHERSLEPAALEKAKPGRVVFVRHR
jgi:hypothetical protein